jgi:broad specificity phosphatase PhoE
MLEELYLIRHAAPDRTLNTPYNVLPGPPLTDQGRREAAEAAAWLDGRGIECLFASRFERASATAEVIAARLGLELRYVEALREGGPGERMEQVQARVAELLRQLDDGPYDRVALVTHGACIRGALLETTRGRLDLKPYAYDNGNCAPTAGIWRGLRSADGWRWALAFRPGIAPTGEPKRARVEWV